MPRNTQHLISGQKNRGKKVQTKCGYVMARSGLWNLRRRRRSSNNKQQLSFTWQHGAQPAVLLEQRQRQTSLQPSIHTWCHQPPFLATEPSYMTIYTLFLVRLLLKQLVTEPQVQLTAKKPFNWLQIRAKKSLQRRTQHELRSGESTTIIKQTVYTLRTNNNKEKLIKDSSAKLKKPYRD